MACEPNRRRDEGVVHGPHLGRWAWLPIPVLLAAMGVFWAAGWQGSHESAYLLLTLNLVFSLLVCLVVTYLIARSFLVRSTAGTAAAGLRGGHLGACRGGGDRRRPWRRQPQHHHLQ